MTEVQRWAHPWIRVGTERPVEGTPSARCGEAAHLGENMAPGGLFLEWHWNGSTLSARNDRYGIYPAFIAQLPDGIALSPDLLKLLEIGAPRDLDPTAIAAFLRTGYFLGDDTPFRHIRALGPGTNLRWTAQEGLTITSGEPECRSNDWTFDQAAKTWGPMFREAMRRRPPLPGKTMLPLSGGRDSRFILLELLALGHPVVGLTTNKQPPYPTNDVPAAFAIAKRTGIEHHLIESGEDIFWTERTKNLRTGLCAEEGGYMVPLCEVISQQAKTTYDGFLGDVLTGVRFFEDGEVEMVRQARLDEVAERMVSYREHQLQRTLSPEAYRMFSREAGMQRIREALALQADKPNPIGSFLTWNRSRREVATQTLALVRPDVLVYFPYLDADLFDAYMGLPAELLLSGDLTVAGLHLAHPDFADVPFEKAFRDATPKRPRHPSLARYGRSMLQALRRRRYTWIDSANAARDARVMALTGFRMHHRNRQILSYMMDLEEWAAGEDAGAA